MKVLMLLILLSNCQAISKVTRISKEVNIVDIETSKVLKVIGPGYYYSDLEYEKLINDQNRKILLLKNSLQIESLKLGLADVVVNSQGKKMEVASELLLSVELLHDMKIKIEKENLVYYKTLHKNKDLILDGEIKKNGLLHRKIKQLKRSNWWQKALQVVAFGIGYKLGDL